MSRISEFASMWVGSLAKITTVKHNIDLQPDSRLAVQHPYQARLKTREHEGQQNDRMLKQGVFEPAMSERASREVFALKKDGNLRFYVDYRKLIAMTLQGTHSLPRMDDCMDSPRDATIFSTANFSNAY